MGSTVARPTHVHSVEDGRRFAGETTLEVVSCWACGIPYAIPVGLARAAERWRGDTPNGWKLCCPLGHTWWYVGETTEEKLRRQLDNARDATAHERARRDQAEASARAHRAVATRRKNELAKVKARVAAGVCPCCNRTFQNLARHMASQHPGYKDGPS